MKTSKLTIIFIIIYNIELLDSFNSQYSIEIEHTDSLCLLNISIFVNVDMTDSISMSEHRYPPPSQLHDATNEVIATARNHKVNLLVQREELSHLFTTINLLGSNHYRLTLRGQAREELASKTSQFK